MLSNFFGDFQTGWIYFLSKKHFFISFKYNVVLKFKYVVKNKLTEIIIGLIFLFLLIFNIHFYNIRVITVDLFTFEYIVKNVI